MQVRCPHCTSVFSSDRAGTQACPHCGAQIHVPEQGGVVEAGLPPPGAGAPPSGGGEAWGGGAGVGGGMGGGMGGGALPPPPDGRGPTPWERRRELGVPRAFWETWRESVLAPQRFWPRVRPDAPWTEALLYGWVVAALSALVALPFQYLDAVQAAQRLPQLHEQMAQLPEQWRRVLEPLLASAADQSFGDLALRALGSAALWPLVFLIGAALLHLCCLLFGAGRHGFAATARAVGYAQGPLVITSVMCVGFLGPLYSLVLVGWGVKALHETSTERAVGVVLLPVLLGCCAACCLGVALAGSMAAFAH